MDAEVVPAILVKTREELLHRISQVRGLVKEIQLDIMDGVFVPNKTIGLEELHGLPEANYEFHWMVQEPEKWIERMPGPHMHMVHIETVSSFEKVEQAVKKAGGQLGLALNPETPLEKVLPYVGKVRRVLIMTVRPGFSGQSYMHGMGEKIRRLREMYPSLDIEVDGGVNERTISHAYASGANILAAASAIFAADDVKSAIKTLKRCALEGCPA